MIFQIDTINILIIFVMLINSVCGLIVYFRNRSDKINILFFILTITISMWGIAMIGYRGSIDHSTVLFMSRLLYFFAIMIPTTFIYFVIIFTDSNAKINTYKKYLLPLPLIILCALSLYPGGFIYDVILYKGKETFIVFNKFTHILFGFYVVGYFSWAYSILYKKYIQANKTLKTQLLYIFIGTFGSTMITLITNLGLLYFGYFALNWVGQVGIIFMITLIFYAILKYHLFNIKVIAIQLITFALWIFILMRVFLARDLRDFMVESGLFIIVLVMGIILIQSILQGIRHRKEIEDLTTDLKRAYDHIKEEF